MGDVVKFEMTERVSKKRSKATRLETIQELYRITRGFEWLNQDEDVRESWERGDFEL